MLALFVLNKLMNGWMKRIVVSLCVLQICIILFFMVRFHPYQQVYFNYLVPHSKEYLRTHYDLDYWGVAYKQGLDFILAYDKASTVKVANSLSPVVRNLAILPISERQRIQLTDPDINQDYFMTNFRNHPENFNYPVVLYNIKVLNSTILKVYLMH